MDQGQSSTAAEDYDIIKSSLDKISAPFFKRTKEGHEKLSARSLILAALEDHRAKQTLPKSIVPMKQPQVPACAEDAFAARFKEINEKACKDVLYAMIAARKQEIAALNSELTKIGSDMESAVMDYLTYMVSMQLLPEPAKLSILNKYSQDLSSRQSVQKKKISTASTLAAFQAKKKQEDFEAKKLAQAMETDNNPASAEVSELKKEIKKLQTAVASLKKAPPHKAKGKGSQPPNPKPGRSAPNPKKPAQKPNPKSQKGKPKPQGKGQGGAGRGAKHN